MENMSSENLILLGLDDKGKKLYSDDYQHILLVAPTGAGKGVCFVIPSLLTFKESVIIHDIKSENYLLTSKYRKSIGHEVFMFNLLGGEGKTSRYNPLDSIKPNDSDIVNDIQKITNLLIENDESYNIQAKNLLTSIILYLYTDTKKPKSLGEVARMVSGNLLDELSSGINKLKNELHHFATNIIKGFLAKDSHTQNFIISSLCNYLEPWNNPLIDYATSKSDFDIIDLKKRKTTIYVGLNPCDIEFLQPVLRFFYDHALDRLMNYTEQSDKETTGVCLFLDEFYSIGRSRMIASSMSYFRGYKIKLFLIAANTHQIENIYGTSSALTIISDCYYKIFFAAYDYDTASVISQITIDRSKNIPLLSEEEIIALPKDKQIILRNQQQAIISKKCLYYDDPDMKNKIQ